MAQARQPGLEAPARLLATARPLRSARIRQSEALVRRAATHATALGVIGAYALLPPDWLPTVSDTFKSSVSYAALISGGATAFLAFISRGIAQPALEKKS